MSPSLRNSRPAGTSTDAVTLASVLGALLRDLGAAQDEANRRRGARAQLADVEIDLPLAIEGTANRPRPACDIEPPRKLLQPHALAFAQKAAAIAAEALRKRSEAAQVVENLGTREFHEHVVSVAMEIVDADAARTADRLRCVVDREILDDPAITSFLPAGSDARKRIRELLMREAHHAAEALADVFRGVAAASIDPEVRVIVDSARLSALTPALIVRVRVKAHLEDDHWDVMLGGS